MAAKDEKSGDSPAAPAPPTGREEFAESLKRRHQAAQGLEEDLLTDVPLLYGSPGRLEPHGDPGIVLARIHQEEMLRRNGGGALTPSGRRSDALLPFERATGALAILILLFLLLADG